MNWRMQTRQKGGGDDPVNHWRFYEYAYDESFWDRLKRRKHFIELDLDPNSRITEDYRDTDYHRAILAEKPFTIKGRNVLEWFEECPPIGSVVLNFVWHQSPQSLLTWRNELWLEARFQNAGQAMMFKLAFGGK